MAYTPYVWHDGDTGGTLVDAAHLNNIELGLQDASVGADSALAQTVPSLFAPAPNGTDDSTALNTWITDLGPGSRFLRPGTYLLTRTLAVPAGVQLFGYGTALRGTSGAFDIVSLAAGAGIFGVEIDGNAATRTGGHGVTSTTPAGTRIRDCYLHDLDGAGVFLTGTGDGWLAEGNRILRCGGQGIYTSASNGCIIGNHIDTAQHGIQWWGGDSNVTSTIGVGHLVIANNTIANVTGGIWGSLGQFITVADNDIDTVGDVGIDFEGCQDCTASGGTVHNAKNACLSTFYFSQRITFSGITCVNDASNAAGGVGAGFKAFSGKTSTQITVEGCTITTTAGAGITTDSGALSSSVIQGNTITVTTSQGKAFRILDGTAVDVLGNRLVHHSGTGISFEGPSDSTIAGNRCITDTDTSTVGSTNGGILLYARSSTYPCQRNRVKDNTVVGYVQGINDSFGTTGNAATANLIDSNIAALVNRTAGTGYTGLIINNRKPADLSAASTTTV